MHMRAAGSTIATRRLYGFDSVQLLCTEEDFGVLKQLYLFTGKVLEEFSGKSKDPPVNWAGQMITKANIASCP